MTKPEAFNQMAEYLHRNTNNRNLPRLSATRMQQRWRTYKHRKFKPTLQKSLTETGLGLTKKEMNSGLSVQGKLEQLCPQFMRMKALFGEKPNVQASDTIALEVSSTSCPTNAPTSKTQGSEYDDESVRHAASDSDSLGDTCGGDIEADADDSERVARDVEGFGENGRDSNPAHTRIEPDYSFASYLYPDDWAAGVDGCEVSTSSPPSDRFNAPLAVQAPPPAAPTVVFDADQRLRSTNTSIRHAQATNTRTSRQQKRKTSTRQAPAEFASKKKRLAANEGKMSLSLPCAKNGKEQIELGNRKLELDERMWRIQQAENQRHLRMQREEKERQLEMDAACVIKRSWSVVRPDATTYE